MLTGPKLQKNLLSNLIRFPFHPVTLSADIAKIYRLIDAEDKDYNRILWKEPNSQDVKTIERSFTFGIVSSDFHSIRTFQVLAGKFDDKNTQLLIFLDM